MQTHNSQNGFVHTPNGLWLPPQKHQPAPRQKRITLSWIGLQGKTLWDWLSLLLLPLLIGLGTIGVTAQQTTAQNTLSQQLHASDQHQHNSDQGIAQQIRYDDLLRAFRDDIDTLNHLRSAPEGSDVRQIASARTLDILQQVDPPRKKPVIDYLSNLGLVQGEYFDAQGIWHQQTPLISLRGADLREANLSFAYLTGANLRAADLTGADLRAADLTGADLSSTIMPDGSKHACLPGEGIYCS